MEKTNKRGETKVRWIEEKRADGWVLWRRRWVDKGGIKDVVAGSLWASLLMDYHRKESLCEIKKEVELLIIYREGKEEGSESREMLEKSF